MRCKFPGARCVPGTMSPRFEVLVATVVASAMCTGCAILAWPSRDARSGILTSSDGRPVANADVGVSTWRVQVPGRAKDGLVHDLTTTTDEHGRFTVRGRAALTFTILGIPEGPAYADEYRFRATGRPELIISPLEREPDRTAAEMRVAFDDRPPLSAYVVPVFGVTAGGSQGFSGHLGAAVLIGRHHRAAGPRVEVELGKRKLGGAVGLTFVHCCRSTLPFPAFELNGRYSRDVEGGHASESGPELAVNLLFLRFTVAALGESVAAPVRDRRFVFGVGYGYF